MPDTPILSPAFQPLADHGVKVLHTVTLRMLDAKSDREIYTIIADALTALIPEGRFILSWIQPDGNNVRMVAHHGFEPYAEKIINLIGIDPYTIDFPLDQLTTEELENYRSRQLNRYPDGIYSLSIGKIPRPVCRAIERILGVEAIYAMGFSVEETHYGGLMLLVSRTMMKKGVWNEQVVMAIETIVNSTALLIRQFRESKLLAEREVNLVMRDITERKLAEEDRRLHADRIQLLLKLFTLSFEEVDTILDFTLEAILKTTRGTFAFMGRVDESASQLTIIRRSAGSMSSCNMKDEPKILKVEEGGLWAEAIWRKTYFVDNNYQSDKPEKKGLPEGHILFSRFLGVPILDGGKVVLLAGIADKPDDFTEADVISVQTLLTTAWGIVTRRHMDLELQEKNRLLQELITAKDKFMSIIAHDLRSPFSVIYGFSEILAKKDSGFENQMTMEIAGKVFHASENYLKLLDNLLIWSRTQTGKMLFEPIKFDLHQLINETIRIHEPVAQKKSISVQCFINHELWVKADQEMISTVIRNLLVNAIKYSFTGGCIEIESQTAENEIVVSVVDHGIGISPERKAGLFSLANSMSTVGTAHEKGTGLGLLLCHEFIERHGGRIWVDSEVGQGSTFRFTLPANHFM